MTKIVQFSLVKEERRLTVEEAWQRFVDAKKRSEETLAIEDGIAAGKAYVAFCELFNRRAS
jgi:hypothetical protein